MILCAVFSSFSFLNRRLLSLFTFFSSQLANVTMRKFSCKSTHVFVLRQPLAPVGALPQRSQLCITLVHTSQRCWFLNTGVKSLAPIKDSYVVTTTWNFAGVWPGRGDLWNNSKSLMTSRAAFSPLKGTTRRWGAHRSNSRTQFVIVEFGTTTRAGKAFQFAAMFPKKVTICTVFPYTTGCQIWYQEYNLWSDCTSPISSARIQCWWFHQLLQSQLNPST